MEIYAFICTSYSRLELRANIFQAGLFESRVSLCRESCRPGAKSHVAGGANNIF